MSQSTGDTIDTLVDSREIPITVDTFIRAATDVEFAKYVSLIGGVNEFYRFRTAPPIDNRPTIRMNQDTLYTGLAVDLSEPVEIILPEIDGRYQSMHVVS